MSQEINYYDCSEGSTNDVYRRFYLKGTIDQVDKYLKDTIESYYDKKDIEELNSDPWGYCVFNNNSEEIDYEYFIDATQISANKNEIEEIESYDIEQWNKTFFYHQIIDLTETNISLKHKSDK